MAKLAMIANQSILLIEDWWQMATATLYCHQLFICREGGPAPSSHSYMLPVGGNNPLLVRPAARCKHPQPVIETI